jgi:hypothetical protein
MTEGSFTPLKSKLSVPVNTGLVETKVRDDGGVVFTGGGVGVGEGPGEGLGPLEL